MGKITEIILEPSRIDVGSNFKLKIKAIRYATYKELKDRLLYTNATNYKYIELKGDG